MAEVEFVAPEITLAKGGSQTEGVDTEEPATTSERAMNPMDVAANGEPETILVKAGSLMEGEAPEGLEIILAAVGSPMAEVEFVAPEITLVKAGSEGRRGSTAQWKQNLTFRLTALFMERNCSAVPSNSHVLHG
jgi:hypothetical protein